MAKIIGKDTYLSKKRLSNEADGLFLLFLLFLTVITMWVYFFAFHFPPIGSLIATAVLFIVFFILKKPIENKLWMTWRYRNGQKGEEYVHFLLKSLPSTYIVAENVVIPPLKSNIDFVVIGPTGVFTVEVKSHRGIITDDGHQLLHNGVPFQEGDILRQVKGELTRLSDYLCSKNISFPEIQPVLVFSNKYTKMYFGKKPVQGALIIGARWLVDTIQNRKSLYVLPVDKINIIQKALEEVSNNRLRSVSLPAGRQGLPT